MTIYSVKTNSKNFAINYMIGKRILKEEYILKKSVHQCSMHLLIFKICLWETLLLQTKLICFNSECNEWTSLILLIKI